MNAREMEEKAFLATFNKGWNEMRVTCQMEKFHIKFVKAFKERS